MAICRLVLQYDDQDLRAPRTAIVSGASSGIGKATVHGLLARGWRIIALGRTPSRAVSALEEFRTDCPEAQVEMLTGDLADLATARRLAAEIRSRTGDIDLLVNNAGATCPQFVLTASGYEQTFAGNHLGPFLLTGELLDRVRPGGRIINVASLAHFIARGGMQWDNLNMERGYDEGAAYAQSKLANLLFTRALSRRAAPRGILVQAVHPGIVSSNFAADSGPLYKLMFALTKPWVRTPEHAAQTILWLAEGGDDTPAGYFANRRPARLSSAARDDDAAERLWSVSEDMVAAAIEAQLAAAQSG